MNVVYFAVGEEFASQAEMAAEALRLTNPSARPWLLTDMHTKASLETFRGHTSAQTLIYDRTLMQLGFLREHGSALFLDSDCVVNRSLDGVFQGPIGVTQRTPPKQVQQQIYNGGVLYGEGEEAIRFWQAWVDMYPQLERGAWAWWGDQMILPFMIPHHPEVNIYGEDHNYAFRHPSECARVMDAFIVHFKGKRKPLMAPYVRLLCGEEIAA